MQPSPIVPETQPQRNRGTGPAGPPTFGKLIDAKAAATLLGVPDTWLLARARARKIPHHRLGHYVRFDPAELMRWLRETRIEPYETSPASRRRAS